MTLAYGILESNLLECQISIKILILGLKRRPKIDEREKEVGGH